MDIVRHPGEDLFFEAILSLRTVEDCRLFFEDVATIKELQAMSQRFRVACLLDGGENYIEVSESTGASSATISRSTGACSTAAATGRRWTGSRNRESSRKAKKNKTGYTPWLSLWESRHRR